MSAWERLRRNRLFWIGAGMLGFALVLALLAPLLAPYDPYAQVRVELSDIYAHPSGAHLLGTDDAGKDILSGLIYGTRVSLLVGFTAALISLFIGGVIGIVAGYRGGRTGNILMRFTDFFLVIPDLALQIVIVAIVGQSLRNIIIVVGVLGWTTTARLVRAQTLTVRERKFVQRAKAIGAGDLHILTRHVFPQVVPLMLANTVLVISLAILSESTLAFIGLGDPTVVSWGQMLNFAFTRGAVSAGAWWALIPPGLAIVWVVLGTTLLGNAAEEVLNPRMTRHHLEPEPPRPEPDASTAAGPIPDTVLAIRDLRVGYESDGGDLVAIDGVSFDVRAGESIGLVGESGCGKTTVMLGSLRLLPPGGRILSGSVWHDGHDLARIDLEELRGLRWSSLAVVFQGAMNALNPVQRVGAQITEAIRLHDPGASQADADTQARNLLDLVGMSPDWATQYPHQFSGGMRQRAMIALALACHPSLVVADEPTTALDVMIQAQVMDLLVRLREEMGMALVLITHNLGVVAETCDRVVVMYGGVVAEKGTVAEVFSDPRHPYTRLLLQAFPDIDEPDRPLVSIPGAPPRLDDLPPGCRFAPRCPQAFERCSLERPGDYPVGDRRTVACFLEESNRG
ncbi:MAG: dipeptide/oligopeptide/nickel ABC transporter permease/ATP-binding protein [Actinobacteria bacterium]|nr:dipeptide/oligopeptide/nickel ABC transporter permease/ATP-binding protein [Actinomycetota bacterium]